jgi:hypothetical protein
LQRAGIDVVVSALTAAENEELGLVEESRCCQRGVSSFFPSPSKTDPFRILPLNLLNWSILSLISLRIAEPESGIRQ